MSEYDLDKITYEPRHRPGHFSTGMTKEAADSLGLATMCYWVGHRYGPYETEESAKEGSARLMAAKQEEEKREHDATALADSARSKLTEEEWDAIYDCGFADGRGYW